MKKLLKIIPILFLVTFNFCRAQDITFSDLTETTSPDASWIMPIESPTVTYKVSWQNFVNKMLAKANTWTGKQTFGQVQFDSSVTQAGSNYFSSATFTPGWQGAGWKLDYNKSYPGKSNLEIDNLTVRGKMSVYEMLVRQVQATPGNLLVTSAAKLNYIAPTDSTILIFEDPTVSGLCPFVKNDLVYAAKYSMSGSVSRVTRAAVDSVYSITVAGVLVPVVLVTYNEGEAFQEGDVVVRFGNTTDTDRQSVIYLASDDAYAPYIQLKSNLSSWADTSNADKTIVWIGDFDGYTDPDFGALSGSGLLAKNVYLKGRLQFTNTQEVADSLWGKLTYSAAWDSLTGRPTFFNTPSGSGLYLDASHMGYYNGSNWMTYMDMAGNFYLGGTSGALQWNGTTLSITGNVTLTNQLSTTDISGLGDLATQNLTDLNLGDLAYEDLVNIAKMDTTLIQGGYLKTTLINTSALVVGPTWGFAAGYDPSTKEDSTGVVTIIDGRVTADYVNAFTIIADSILSNSITSTKIASGSVTAEKLSVDSLSAISGNLGTLTAGTINATTVNVINLNASNLTTGIIDTVLIADGTISQRKLAVDSLSAIVANLGTVTAGNITGVNISGSTITGGTVQTAATGSRVVLSGNSLQAIVGDGTSLTVDATMPGISILGSDYSTSITGVSISSDDVYSIEATNGVYINGVDASTFLTSGSFATVATTGSYTDLINKPSIPTATSDLTNDSGFITTSALSDYATQLWVSENYLQDGAVYAWALAATKPSYNFSEIGSKPTTISGYGITDAVSTGRTITINGTAQDLSANRTWTITNISGNAATVTNGVYTTGSYSNPTWLTGLAWSKISSVPTASSTQSGVLSSTDWSTFNGKANAFTGATGHIQFYDLDSRAWDITVSNGIITGWTSM